MSRKTTVIEAIHSALVAQRNCKSRACPNTEWAARWSAYLDRIARELLPHGSGFDIGTVITSLAADGHGVKFWTEFHHMDDNGGYDGWTQHTIVVRPTFGAGVDLRTTGRDRNQIKDYIADVFGAVLTAELPGGFAP